jgi:hypothetical protein
MVRHDERDERLQPLAVDDDREHVLVLQEAHQRAARCNGPA